MNLLQSMLRKHFKQCTKFWGPLHMRVVLKYWSESKGDYHVSEGLKQIIHRKSQLNIKGKS